MKVNLKKSQVFSCEKELLGVFRMSQKITLLLPGPARGGFRGDIVPGPGSTGARAQGARKSSGFPIKLKYRTITP